MDTAGHALHMAELTLRKMAAGGIHDHIGGGFARLAPANPHPLLAAELVIELEGQRRQLI